jgi:hypothetical protein
MVAVDRWGALCPLMAVAVVRWAPTVAEAGRRPMAEAVVAGRAALVGVVEATCPVRVEAVATIALVAEAAMDTADSIQF